MQKLVTRCSQKAGLPPGTLVHIGDRKRDDTRITLMDYSENGVKEKEADIKDEFFSNTEKSTVRWINVEGIHDISVMEYLGKRFGIHSLVLEDILNTGQRPKIEDYGNYIYIAVKVPAYDRSVEELVIEQESLIVVENYVITFGEKETDIFNPVRERIRQGVGKIRKMGADYLAYTLLDIIVDNYFIVLEELGERVEYIEDETAAKPSPDTLKEIHKLKRQMLFLHKSIWPLREVAGFLERGESSLFKEPMAVYIRDLYDHIIQVMDTTETLRDILSSILDIYLSSVSNRMNEIMKVLTVISTVFMPISFIVGLYGMNLRNMPEYDWPWTYPVVWLMIISTVCIMLVFFKKKKWL